MQAAQRHGVPLAGWTPAAFAARPSQCASAEEDALLVTRLRPLRGQHAHSALSQRPHARSPAPPAPDQLNLDGHFTTTTLLV